MSDPTLIGPGPTCAFCGGDYGEHAHDCPNNVKALTVKCRTPCDPNEPAHDWQSSEWKLVVWKVINESWQQTTHVSAGPRVDVCRRCGALRVREEDRG